MSFNKRFLPEVDVLEKRREQYASDLDFFNAIVGKADCFIGSEESMEYLDRLEKKLFGDEEEK